MEGSARDGEERHGEYLGHLPACYQSPGGEDEAREADFTRRFLCIFEDVLKPVEGVVDNLAFYFDPGTAPRSFLPWLASWVGLTLDERWPEARRRELIRSTAELYRWRGTKRGLSEYLRIYTGVTPHILEDTSPIQPEKSHHPGDAEVGPGEQKAHCFTVILQLPDVSAIDVDIARDIIELQKPAHTAYILQVLQAGEQGSTL